MSTMAAQQDTEPPILKLPAELTEAIADDVDAADLRALKLTCRYLNTNVQRAFIRAHFTEQSFILASPERMQALVDVTQHEVYGKVIRKLNLLVARLPKERPSRHEPYGHRATAKEQPPRDRSTRAQKRDVAPLYEATFKKQERYWNLGEWKATLRKALLNLATTTTGISIEVRRNVYMLRSACGLQALKQQLEQDDCLEGFNNNLGPELLQTISENWSKQHDVGLFSSLRTVDVDTSQKDDLVDLIVAGLGCALTLEHFTVRVDNSWLQRTGYNQALAGTVHLPKLREFGVSGSYPDPQHLAAFCTRYCKTLKRLTMCGDTAGTYPQAVANREQGRTAIEKAWSAAGITGIEFELS
ncbi:hypothetical protein LTR15_001400 [Elasticomyces elasticus]|nr:hypothetical protein LTR15_001400 [Elasticomyces elasticus]